MQREKDESKLAPFSSNLFLNEMVQLPLLLSSFSRFGTLLTNVLTILSVIGKHLNAPSVYEDTVLVQAIVANWT